MSSGSPIGRWGHHRRDGRMFPTARSAAIRTPVTRRKREKLPASSPTERGVLPLPVSVEYRPSAREPGKSPPRQPLWGADHPVERHSRRGRWGGLAGNSKANYSLPVVPFVDQRVSRKVSPQPRKEERDHGAESVIPYFNWVYNESGRHDLNVRPLRPERAE